MDVVCVRLPFCFGFVYGQCLLGQFTYWCMFVWPHCMGLPVVVREWNADLLVVYVPCVQISGKCKVASPDVVARAMTGRYWQFHWNGFVLIVFTTASKRLSFAG